MTIDTFCLPLTMAVMLRACAPIWIILLHIAAGELPAQPPADHAQEATDSMRIVSLSPAVSQMLVDMQLGDRIVAVAQYDKSAAQGLPVVGNYLEVDIEGLIKVRPTHVITVFGKEGVPRQLQRLADHGRFTLVSYDAPLSVQAVADMLVRAPTDDLPPGLGTVLGSPQAARHVKQRMLDQLGQIEKLTAPRKHPRVLMVIATHPVMASGPHTTHDELLAIAGGTNAAAAARVGAPTYDREGLLQLRPDVVLLLLPATEPLRSVADDPRLANFRGLRVPAVRDGRIVLLNDPLVLLPSSSMPRIAAQMARALHPELTEQIDQIMAPPPPPPESSPAAPSPAPQGKSTSDAR